MIEKLVRWLLPKLYKWCSDFGAQVLIGNDLQIKNHDKVCKYLGALAAQNKLTHEELKALRRDLDTLAASQLTLAEKSDKLNLLSNDILKSLPIGGSQVVPFPEAVQKRDKAWPRK